MTETYTVHGFTDDTDYTGFISDEAPYWVIDTLEAQGYVDEIPSLSVGERSEHTVVVDNDDQEIISFD